MSWREITIDDLVSESKVEIQTGPFGTQLKASDYTEDGTPVINVRNIGYGTLRQDKLEFVPDTVANRLHIHVLQENDIVFGRKGAVDRHLFVTKNEKGWIQGSDCIRMRFGSDDINPRYVSYWFLQETHKQWMITQCSNKSTMASLNQDVIKRIPIKIPDLSIQNRIVDILSAYDDLIENNQRRIELLEQSARLLYKEWFVHFRFPGHERVKIVDGVPEGWERKTAFDVMEVLSGGTPKTSVPDYWDGEIPFFTPKDVSGLYVYDTEKSLTELGLQNCNSKLYPKDTVFITARGTVGKLGLAQRPMAMNQSCYALVARPPLSQYFLYFSLLHSVEQFRTRAAGSVFDAIVRDTFKLIPFLVPNPELIEQFTDRIRPVLNQIDNLLMQNQKLKQARDLLLPRLMKGEITV